MTDLAARRARLSDRLLRLGKDAQTRFASTEAVSSPELLGEQSGAVPTGAQQVLLHLAVDPHAGYRTPIAAELRGDVDPRRLADAIDATLARHQALSLRFALEAGGYRWSLGDRPSPTELSESASRLEAVRAFESRLEQPFDLARGALARALLHTIPGGLCVLLDFHHLAVDGVSVGMLLHEIAERYAGISQSAASPFHWSRHSTSQASSAMGAEPVPHANASAKRRVGKRLPVAIPRALTKRVEDTARQLRTTPSAVLFAAFGVASAGVLGRDALRVHVPVSTRTDSTVGFFVATPVTHFELVDEPVHALVARATHSLREALLHEGAREPERDSVDAETLLFSVQDGHAPTFVLPGVQVAPIALDPRRPLFDAGLVLHRAEDQSLTGYFEGTLDDDAASDWLATFLGALERLDAAATTLALIEDPSACLVGPKWSLHPRLVSELFADAVRLAPDAIGCIHGDSTLTYGTLELHVAHLAQTFRSLGLGEGSVVAVSLPHEPRLIAALIAVWRIGAVLLPIDPDLPHQRRAELLEEADAHALVLTAGDTDEVEVTLCPTRLRDTPRWLERLDAQQPAYILFTSGTTGRPRGVVVSHPALANLLASMAEQVPTFHTRPRRWLASTSIGFDISLLELLGPLVRQETLVLAGNARQDLRALAAIANHVDVLQATPTVHGALLRAGIEARMERTTLTGGEPLHGPLASALMRVNGVVLNVYGPTETTIWSTCERLCEPVSVRPSVGHALHETTVAVERGGVRMRPGVVGEVVIEGHGVALGYTTAEEGAPRFEARAAGRVYRTGDRGRLRRGRLEVLGRSDRQVKVHGVRIELEEVESLLLRDGVAGPSSTPFAGCAAIKVGPKDATNEGASGIAVFVTPRAEAHADVESSASSAAIAEDWATLWSSVFEEPRRDGAHDLRGWITRDGSRFDADEMAARTYALAEALRLSPASRVLEVGPGGGDLAAVVQPRCSRLVLLEVAPRAVAELRARFAETEVEVVCGNVQGAWPEGPFDRIVLDSVVQYLPSLRALSDIVRKAAASLHVDGALVLGDVRMSELAWAAAEADCEDALEACLRIDSERELLPSLADLQRMAGDVGLSALFNFGRPGPAALRRERVDVEFTRVQAQPQDAREALALHLTSHGMKPPSHAAPTHAPATAWEQRRHADQARRRLAEVLPAAVLPETILCLRWLPRRTSGKVDVARLQRLVVGRTRSRESPVGELETLIAQALGRCLGRGTLSRDDDFFALGGHSLLALEAVRRLEEQGIHIELAALFSGATPRALALRVRAREERAAEPTSAPPRAAELPRNVLAMFLAEKQSARSHTLPIVLERTGRLAREDVRRALDALSERHDALRTAFLQRGRRVEAVTLDHATIPLNDADAEHPFARFDLAVAPLAHATLAQTEHTATLSLFVSHLITDGVGAEVLARELSALLGGRVLRGHATSTRELLRNVGLRERGTTTRLRASTRAEQLVGSSPPRSLERAASPGARSSRGHMLRATVHEASGIVALGEQAGVSLFAVILHAFAKTWMRFTGERRTLLGLPAPLPERLGSPTSVAMLTGIVPVACERAREREGLAESLRRVHREVGCALSFADVPIEEVERALGFESVPGEPPVVSALVTLLPAMPALSGGFRVVPVHDGTCSHDAGLTAWPEGGALQLALEYACDRVDGWLAQALLDGLVAELAGLATQAGRGAPEVAKSVAVWSSPSAPAIDPVARWRSFVSTHPDAPALTDAVQTLSRAALAAWSDRVRQQLAEEGVGAGDVVAVALPMCAELSVLLIALLEVGAVYVPVEHRDTERRARILAQVAPKLVFVERDKRDLESALMRHVVEPRCDHTHAPLPLLPARPDDETAYILFTSGSTGEPKGVVVSRGALRAFFGALVGALPEIMRTEPRVACITEPSFDISLLELLLPLATGGALVFDWASTGAPIDILQTTPTRMRQLEAALRRSPPRVCVLGGERLEHPLVAHLQAAGLRVLHAYGPTEATIWTSVSEVPQGAHETTIGLPLGGMTHGVVDETGDLVAMGEVGELVLAGPQLASGVLAKSDARWRTETRETYRKLGLSRFYRTGDQVRMRPTGALDFLGRIDDQLKVRGHRVEPGEIEEAIRKTGLVEACTVTASRNASGDVVLAAWVVGRPAGAQAEVLAPLEASARTFRVDENATTRQVEDALTGLFSTPDDVVLQDVEDAARVRAKLLLEAVDRAGRDLDLLDVAWQRQLAAHPRLALSSDRLAHLARAHQRHLTVQLDRANPTRVTYVLSRADAHRDARSTGPVVDARMSRAFALVAALPNASRALGVADLRSRAESLRGHFEERDPQDEDRAFAVGPRGEWAREAACYEVGAGAAEALEPLRPDFAAALRRAVAELLPPALVPSLFVPLSQLPMTVAGKADRVRLARALSLLDVDSLPRRAPTSIEERALLDALEGELGLASANLDASFLEAGGASLAAIRVSERLHAMGYELPAEALTTGATLAEIAATLTRQSEPTKVVAT